MDPFGPAPWDPGLSAFVLVASAAVLLLAGSRLAHVVDRIADRSGMGEALAGAVLLGATTSIPGLVTTVVAARHGDAELAVSNAVGGIAAQTVFLAVADTLYREANLEHAAASVPNLMQTALLIALIALVLMASVGPDPPWLGIHPVTLLLPAVYVYGLVLTRRSREAPMWRPRKTAQTRPDVPDEEPPGETAGGLALRFLGLGAAVALCGFAVGRAGVSLAARTELSGTLIGGLFTSVVTSLPELVTVIAAVRAGALTLAVSDIIGGNTFDVLFIAAGDAVFRDGSIYAAVGPDTLFLLGLTILLTSLLAAGLVYRARKGIGFEGLAILACYFGGFAVLLLGG